MAIPAPGAHGGDADALARALGVAPADILDLSASMNPAAPDVAAIVGRHLGAVGRYPDPTRATAALAEAIGVDSDELLLTNGGAEAIALVAAEIGGHVEGPEFGLYERYLHLPPPFFVAPDPDSAPGATQNVAGAGLGGPAGLGDRGRWRSNPHNPTGLLAGAEETAAVWDEAFWPLATGTWTRRDASAGAVVLGSLTKLLSCPGLRAGYAMSADTGLVGRLRRRQPQWSVNGLVASALPELLETVDLGAWAAEIRVRRADLEAVLRRHGFAPRPSDANWLLIDAPGLRARLGPLGVLVRDCASFGLPGVVRVAVPGSDGLVRLDQALTTSAG